MNNKEYEAIQETLKRLGLKLYIILSMEKF